MANEQSNRPRNACDCNVKTRLVSVRGGLCKIYYEAGLPRTVDRYIKNGVRELDFYSPMATEALALAASGKCETEPCSPPVNCSCNVRWKLVFVDGGLCQVLYSPPHLGSMFTPAYHVYAINRKLRDRDPEQNRRSLKTTGPMGSKAIAMAERGECLFIQFDRDESGEKIPAPRDPFNPFPTLTV